MSRSSDPPKSPLPHDRHAATTNRRVFLGRVIGGLAIAVPAFQVLASPASASAVAPDSHPDGCTGGCINPCAKTYSQYVGHACGHTPIAGGGETCPTGVIANCIGLYNYYSTTTYQLCSQSTDDEGPCG